MGKVLPEKFGRHRMFRFHLWHLDGDSPPWPPLEAPREKVVLWPLEDGELGSSVPVVEPTAHYFGMLGNIKLCLCPATEADCWHLSVQLGRQRACSIKPFFHTWIHYGIEIAVEHLTGSDCRYPEREARWFKVAGAGVERNPLSPANSKASRHRKSSARIASRSGVVYFLQGDPGTPIKIGFSKNLEVRLKSIRTASATPVKVLAAIDALRSTEAELHKRFACLRMNGEWFQPGPELVEFIQQLDASAIVPAAVLTGEGGGP